jgi:hypothetical protein
MNIPKQKWNLFIPLFLIIIWIIITYRLYSMFYTFIFIGWSFWIVDVWWYTIPYQEDTAVIISTIAFIILMFLFFKIIKTDKQSLRIKLWIIWILIWVFSNILWILINPMYTFDNHPEIFWYMDSEKKHIENVDKYIKLVDKYWSKFHNNFLPPKTLEEHIKIIDFAINWNYETVWQDALYSAWDIYWYDELFKSYHDKTAEILYLHNVMLYNRVNEWNWLYDNYKWFYYLKDYWSTPLIKQVSEEMFRWYEENKNSDEIDFYTSRDNRKENATNRYYDRLLSEKWINSRLLELYKYKKDKFLQDENWDYYMVKDYYMNNEKDKVNWY